MVSTWPSSSLAARYRQAPCYALRTLTFCRHRFHYLFCGSAKPWMVRPKEITRAGRRGGGGGRGELTLLVNGLQICIYNYLHIISIIRTFVENVSFCFQIKSRKRLWKCYCRRDPCLCVCVCLLVPCKRFLGNYWTHHHQIWRGDCLRHENASHVIVNYNYIDLDFHSRSHRSFTINSFFHDFVHFTFLLLLVLVLVLIHTFSSSLHFVLALPPKKMALNLLIWINNIIIKQTFVYSHYNNIDMYFFVALAH